MGLRKVLSKPFAAWVIKQQNKWVNNPVKYQEKTLQSIVKKAANTAFGKDHDFENIHSHEDFKKRVPIRGYEDLRPYIDRIVNGEKDITWPGLPQYLAKTSGTTSGNKYIPITKDSVPNHINGARDALLNYVHETGNSAFLDKKLIFLSGSPTLSKKNGILTGRLSGISNHHVPGYLKGNQLPSYETNCIEDFETKVERVIDETLGQPMSLISGIPPWIQMYFDRITARTGKPIKDVFPDFTVFVYGGVNFEPYRKKLFDTIGRPVDSIETFPASEGFVAFQDSQQAEGMLILLNSGIFFEFVPVEEAFEAHPTRLNIGEVETGKNYLVIINSNAGLWGYSLGDTVKFVSTYPHRLVVTGRIKHFISAFGEHVIAEEVEKALQYTMEEFPECEVIEFTVAPQVNPEEGLPLHEWYVEFGKRPNDLKAFEERLDAHLQKLNAYYFDLIDGKILRPLKVIPMAAHAFQNYMKTQGKLGGQNKLPRLANDRRIADDLQEYVLNVNV